MNQEDKVTPQELKEMMNAIPDDNPYKPSLAKIFKESNWTMTPDAEEVLHEMMNAEELKLRQSIEKHEEMLEDVNKEIEITQHLKEKSKAHIQEELPKAEKRFEAFKKIEEELEQAEQTQQDEGKVEELKKNL